MNKAKKLKKKKGEEGHNKKSEKKIHASWNKSPEEIIKKRTSQYVHVLEENEGIDVLELFLSR